MVNTFLSRGFVEEGRRGEYLSRTGPQPTIFPVGPKRPPPLERDVVPASIEVYTHRENGVSDMYGPGGVP